MPTHTRQQGKMIDPPSKRAATGDWKGRLPFARRPVAYILALILLLGGIWRPVSSPAYAQTETPQEKARNLLSKMTPRERVGQLFLVTFKGTDISEGTPIYDLINNYFVGGVVFLAKNGNFTDLEKPLDQAAMLTRQLQLERWASSQKARLDPGSNQEFTPKFVPLLIGMPQEGDGYPFDQLLNGLTPLPNEMALGATWNPIMAQEVGKVMGQELSALGINLLLGPSLDVLEAPHMEETTDLGTRTFGGDPFWVGEMGKSYIEGVHQGSQDRVAVVATHFPGFGASDRLPEEEVATVRKTLDQLRSFDLQPFFAVTGNAPTSAATTDALLASHIRYQGFQGNFRLSTRPVSFDPQAFSQLMSLPPLDSWRKNGGVMISDNLGSRAVRGYYELTNQTFDMPRRVALNAFQAGNDLLYVDDFSSGDLDSYTSAVHTLDFFAQKYQEDPFFAQRVDESVERILTLKYRLYGSFSLGLVQTSLDMLNQIGQASQISLEVAQQAATLISPTQAELNVSIPDPPNQNDRIVFISDDRTARQCDGCANQALLGVNALQDVVLRRYGPQAGGQVIPNNLVSYSLEDLQSLLLNKVQDSEIESDLKRANWIVFTMLNASNSDPSFKVLNTFLSQRPDLFQQKRLIVFAFNAPYFLDATNISKLTAYYGLYSKIPQFVDVAAYFLFQDLRPVGALPVSVPGVYDLEKALLPDPDQTISLSLDSGEPETTTAGTPVATPTQTFQIGDVVPVRTGVILDHNGHPVPDGTPVEFVMSVGGETNAPRQVETTSGGIARTTFQINSPGALDIRAQSEPARQSSVLHIDVQSDNLNGQPVTETPEPTQTASPTPTATATPQPGAIQEPPPPPRPHLGDWSIAILLASILAWSSYRLAALIGQVRWGVRSGFLVLIGGLLAYTYLVLRMPGSQMLTSGSIGRGVILMTLIGSAAGLLATWIWRALSLQRDDQ